MADTLFHGLSPNVEGYMDIYSKGTLNSVIFLLGAGASVDAGMPMIAQLTKQLRERLPEIPDLEGIVRPEFAEVFDFIKEHDKSIADNYEKFFEWISLLLLLHDQAKPFHKIIKVQIERPLIDAMRHLVRVIGGEIKRLLESRRIEPSYFARLADFLPDRGRLKIFSLNYDCCVEEACRAASIDLTTGFDPISMKWRPALFRSKVKGINLYKLHGSLRWFSALTEGATGETSHPARELLEVRPEQRTHLPAQHSIRAEPELILGPGNKVHFDDPFPTLLYEFHRSVQQARICVVIGYGQGDKHIQDILYHAICRGLFIVNVNPGGGGDLNGTTARWHPIRLPAKKALESGRIRGEIDSVGDAPE